MGWCNLSDHPVNEGDMTACEERVEGPDGEEVCAGTTCEYYYPGAPPDRMEDEYETPDEFEARCLARICEEPEAFYQRATIVRLENERLEAAQDVWQTAVAIRDAKRLRVFPRNPDSCMQWGRACDFFQVCLMADNGEDFEGALSALYVEGDPLERYLGADKLDDSIGG